MTTCRRFSKQGITGQGVHVAIIDQRLLLDHIEYKDQLASYADIDTGRSDPAVHVAGVVACGLQVNPDLPVDQIDRLLYDSGWDFQRGKLINPQGFVNAARRTGSNDRKGGEVSRAESKGQTSEGMAK